LFNIYPNPTKDKITLTLKQSNPLKNTFLSIFSIQWQLLLQQRLRQEKTEFDLAGFAKGIYILKLNRNDITEFIKIVKD